MKKIFKIVVALLLTTNVWAQSPEKISYQAVIRDADNALLSDEIVGMQISILKTSSAGTAVYVETQTLPTNVNGLVSLEIGAGTLVSGDFTSIDWANDSYFIKTEIDPEGGTNYTITGTSQLLSVPYALHAKTAETVASEVKYEIGDFAQGGIVFYVDASGKHGLVIAMDDLENQLPWNDGSTTRTMGDANGLYAGSRNTTLIIANQGAGNGNSYAAYACANYKKDELSDWYLPSLFELNYWIYPQLDVINAALSDNEGTVLSTSNYWSSSQDTGSPTQSHWFNFTNNNTGISANSTLYSVRAIRRF
ncbi:hypothetical protein [Aureivirga sp. CE67]|uniref:hypothetical protein n=1 Tax=Aureivirga sp. CE67 TaxID=1788983 RepID=UPI0018CAD02A|nr:hypothetical protein [Aureivirga sp. CE67]